MKSFPTKAELRYVEGARCKAGKERIPHIPGVQGQYFLLACPTFCHKDVTYLNRLYMAMKQLYSNMKERINDMNNVFLT